MFIKIPAGILEITKLDDEEYPGVSIKLRKDGGVKPIALIEYEYFSSRKTDGIYTAVWNDSLKQSEPVFSTFIENKGEKK